jgi:hypothetical protein
MQALSRNSTIIGYVGDMPMGRPITRDQTEFGQQLFERREAAGLTQAEVATQLGISQRAYSAWASLFGLEMRPRRDPAGTDFGGRGDSGNERCGASR